MKTNTDIQRYLDIRRKMLYRKILLIRAYKVYAVYRMALDTLSTICMCASIIVLILMMDCTGYQILAVSITFIVVYYLLTKASIRIHKWENRSYVLMLNSNRYSWPRADNLKEIKDSSQLILDQLYEAKECILPVLFIIKYLRRLENAR